MSTEIYVCHAGPCRRAGAEAVLTEIEELATVVGGCSVRESGCLGYCSEAPNALVRRRGDEEVYTKIRSLETSVKVVEHATGRKAQIEDAKVQERFAALRAARTRQAAREVSHWNAALHGLTEQAAQQPHLQFELNELLTKAGYPNGLGPAMPNAIDNYSPWSLQSVEPVTRHSAIFRFKSSDRKRGTPHPRGRSLKPDLITWHTTLLAEVGKNSEGPLPWIERDYTPISSAKEWEAGRCDMLVKIYARGAATSWLRQVAPLTNVWLSRPTKTLHVPSLTPEMNYDGSCFPPASVLLLLAGTGVVALPQILHHRNPVSQLGLCTHKRDQLRVPIDVVLSCRKDDVLLLPNLVEWCRAGEIEGVRHCTLLLTDAAAESDQVAYPESCAGNSDDAMRALEGLPNACVVRSRISSAIVAEAVARMPHRCRVVVSGPGGFNSAVRSMLADVIDDSQITVLSA